jgi:predicted nucleic acid-binding protein
MKDKFFIDTNIVVYAFSLELEKKLIAKQLIKDAHKKDGCLSFQVIQEFLNTSTKKFKIPLKKEDAQRYLHEILFPICEIFPSEKLYSNALDIHEKFKFSFYDSLIIAAALQANCKILYSEDLQHNQKIYDLTIVNPFNN